MAKSKGKTIKSIKGVKGRVVTVKHTTWRRKRKERTKGKVQKRYCVAAVGGDLRPPAAMARKGVTVGRRMGGCYSANAEGKKKALAKATHMAKASKL